MVKRFFSSATRTIAVGFAALILVGAALLSLPISNRAGEWLSFFDALFTATSATCVTGLVVCDTWTQFSVLGQIILLLLIQIGGLGFMTVALLFSMALKKPVGLRQRGMLMEAVSSLHIGGVVALVRRILIGTLIVEGLGAALLYIRFCGMFGAVRGAWYAVFHSVSAFCNAGFDLMGASAPYSSLTAFATDPIVSLTVTALILVGGIGFIVWDDIVTCRLNFRKYKLHSKIMLVASLVLVVGGTALMYVLERGATMADMSVGERLLAALFQAVTPRTAGFNTVDLAALSEGGSLLTMLLMMIGAGTGSTGGGLKVTTVVALLLSMKAFLIGRDDVEVGGRRLEPGLVRRAASAASLYVVFIAVGAVAIMAIQPIPMKDVLFEVFSALSTVGLSTGITRALLPASRVILILLMYCGRVGSLTVFMAVAENRRKSGLRYPEEKIIVG